jgi:hypothetical protein
VCLSTSYQVTMKHFKCAKKELRNCKV